MPRSKNGNKREKVKVENLKEAIALIENNGLSVRTAAKECSLSRTTLQRHYDLHKKRGDADFTYENKCSIHKVFSKEEEKSLKDYLLKASGMHYGLSKADLKRLAYQFAKANGKKYPEQWNINCQAGEQWLVEFRKRNPELSLRTPRPTSIGRATGFNKPVVELFFNKYANILEKHKLTAERVFNVDETGVSSVHRPPKVIASKKLKQVGGITSTERGFNTTVIACINAVGNSVPPVFVFPRVHFKRHMLNGAPPGSYGTCNQSGWSTGEIFVEFLDHFIKHVKPDKDNKVLLIMDNHESHITVEAINKAKDNGIILFTIPPHTSHKLQPLDRGVFGPFKSYYNVACKNWLLSNPGKPLSVYDIAAITGKSYPLAFTPSNIIAGFSSSGLWPINQYIFSDDEYLASSVSERPNPNNNDDNNEANDELIDQHDLFATGLSAEHEYSASVLRPNPDGLLNDELIDIPDICAGPSNSSIATIAPNKKPSTIVTPQSPEEIRPFPKAERKKLTTKGRKPGKCRVLTDTPEKQEIEADAEKRKKIKVQKINTSLFNEKKKTGKTNKLKRKTDDYTSDDSFASFLSEESNIGIKELLERNEMEEEEELRDYEIFSEKPIQDHLNKWVLVSFKTKVTIKHYVGQITRTIEGCPVVKFARRIKKTSVFIWPQENDEGEIQREDIVVFLPAPVIGRRGQLSFPVSFSGYNVC